MRNEHEWRPSKYATAGKHLAVGPQASPGSWLITRVVAEAYDRHLPAHARGRLIDLGCGKVPLYSAYRKLVSAVTCVDWSHSRHGVDHIDVAHDLNQPLPFADASFDTVVLSDVLEHVMKPDQLLAEVRRILAPGGKLLMNVPFLYWLHEQPHDYFRYTQHGLALLIKQAGLQQLVLETLGGPLEVISDVSAKHVARVPLLGALFAQALQRAAFAATRPALVQRLSLQSRLRFPLGYFLVALAPSSPG